MFPDISKLHTKTILTIEGPVKQFPTKAGLRERFDITFTDSYKAEYCPLVGQTQDLPKSGQEFTFKIVHRGAKGDEIDKAFVEAQAPASNGYSSSKVVNMNGHPAVTALNAAIKMAEINNEILKPEKTLPSDVLETADMMLDWLLMKQNNC